VRMGTRPAVSEWMLTVAQVLPLPHRAELPYTIGDAVLETGAWARAADPSRWKSRETARTVESLRVELRAQLRRIGPRLTDAFAVVVADLIAAQARDDILMLTGQLTEMWAQESTIVDAFWDLCDAARQPDARTKSLRWLADVIASRVGPAARGGLSALSEAANALVSPEEDLRRRGAPDLPDAFSEEDRVELALRSLRTAPDGHVIVWLAYTRAITEMRMVAGPMTFLRADWALPNAFEDGPNDFPERDELRAIRADAFWLDPLMEASLRPENRIVLVRVDLGQHALAGALEEAQHRVEAVLSVVITSGGASWLDTGSRLVLLDGTVRMSSGFPDLHEPTDVRGTWGMGDTATVVTEVIDALNVPLSSRSMPEPLVEALTTLREARMTNHRDVLFHDAREVSPRIATALEDHAMELFAAAMNTSSKAFADAVNIREALRRAGRLAAGGLLAPFDRQWSDEEYRAQDELERKVTTYQHGSQLVSVSGVVAHLDDLRRLPMSDLQRADFEAAVTICTDPVAEKRFLEQIQDDTHVLQLRHRRVRNAINHGLPLNAAALHSVRDYAERASGTGLNIAMNWFIADEDGPSRIDRPVQDWLSRMRRIEAGVSWADHDASAR
jgi:hypothetical protein